MFFSESVEFSQYKEILDKHFTTCFGRKKLAELKPSEGLSVIEKKQKYIKEAFFLTGIISLQLPRDDDYFAFYGKLKDPYASFTVEDIATFRDFHKEVSKTKKTLLESNHCDVLRDFLKDIYSLGDLLEDIDSKITFDCKVKDGASPNLKQTRSSLKITRKKLMDHLNKIIFSGNAEKFVQEQVIKEVKGRYVIPVKSNFRQYFNGVVYSSSNTGQTLYVEPTSAVDMNNYFEKLKSEEEEEILKILQNILSSIKSHIYEVTSTVTAYTEIVFYLETALLFKDTDVIFPEFGEDIVFKDVHHPLIYLMKKDESVPVDFEMTGGCNLAVITGPNTGGKTAVLKSVGLNTVIAKCGLPIFGESAKLINFRSVYADIGDHQSLILDLSTFSSHMVNIKEIIDSADENSLVLLDEVGTGTEPREGAALAVAIIKNLLSKGAKVIVTTHFSEIKNYAVKNTNAMVYSVDFDYENFIPRYRLLPGVVGKSSPIIIARKLGFDGKVLEDADYIIADSLSKAEFKLEEVNELKAEVERRAYEQGLKEEFLSKKIEELEHREKNLERKLKMKESELLEESYSLLQKLRRRVNSKKVSYAPEKIEKDISATENKLKQLKQKQKPVENLKQGDVVFLEKYGKEARVLEINENKVFIELSGIRVNMNREDIIGKKIDGSDNISQKEKVKISKPSSGGVARELVIIGKTVEEGWDILDKFIDKALLAGVTEIAVVHGRGSGTLKKGIRKYLKNDSRVESYREAGTKEGGQAVTIVKL